MRPALAEKRDRRVDVIRDRNRDRDRDRDLKEPKSTRAQIINMRAGGLSGVHWSSPSSKNKFQMSHKQSTAKWQDKPTLPSSSLVRHDSNVAPAWQLVTMFRSCVEHVLVRHFLVGVRQSLCEELALCVYKTGGTGLRAEH